MLRSYFTEGGVHVLVDGQFGSTGKGLFASFLAERAAKSNTKFTGVLSNAGPNSGHTFYGPDGEKIVLKQLPSFAVASQLWGAEPIPVYLTAGAIIDPAILIHEALKFPSIEIHVHENAAVITDAEKMAERTGTVAAVAGTRSGTGHAIANKVLRNPKSVFSWHFENTAWQYPPNIKVYRNTPQMGSDLRYFMEVSQGFSLGLNSEFYPKVTSRECTVMQAIADARIAPYWVNRTYMVVRTFPIRVGNVDGFSSGDHYDDQYETSWQELGVEPELTTVTQRVRRVFTWSDQQFEEAVTANRPDFVLLNFMNYIKDPREQARFKDRVDNVGFRAAVDFTTLYGWGAKNDDISPF
jgi:adenylosuccinate synthase